MFTRNLIQTIRSRELRPKKKTLSKQKPAPPSAYPRRPIRMASASGTDNASRKKVNKLVTALLGGIESFSARKAVHELAKMAEDPAQIAFIRQAGGEARLAVMAGGGDSQVAQVARAVLALVEGADPMPLRKRSSIKASTFRQHPKSSNSKPSSNERSKHQKGSRRGDGPSLPTLGEFIAVARAASPTRKADIKLVPEASCADGNFTVGVDMENARNQTILQPTARAACVRAER